MQISRRLPATSQSIGAAPSPHATASTAGVVLLLVDQLDHRVSPSAPSAAS